MVLLVSSFAEAETPETCDGHWNKHCKFEPGGEAAGDGALLSLVVQLAGVELAMCLYDQPAELVGEHAARRRPG